MGVFGKLFGSKKSAPVCAVHAKDLDLVRPEDKSWWTGLSYDDVVAFEAVDNAAKLAAFKSSKERDGVTSAEAALFVRLRWPYYYLAVEARDEPKFSLAENDAPLPYLLKGRINDALQAGKITKAELQLASSFNAHVRSQIRGGNL